MKETGIDLIALERERQITEEGWTPDHDDAHPPGTLAAAAACYARAAEIAAARQASGTAADQASLDEAADFWPWNTTWWKPRPDPITNLTRAGALIAAEIDRLLRERERHETAIGADKTGTPTDGISVMMRHALTKAKEGGNNRLYCWPGGLWMPFQMIGAPTRTSTIKALLKQGLMRAVRHKQGRKQGDPLVVEITDTQKTKS